MLKFLLLLTTTLALVHSSFSKEISLKTDYQLHPKDGYTIAWGKWATSRSLSKAFIFNFDQEDGVKTAQELVSEIGDYYSPTSYIGVAAWNLTFNGVSKGLANSIGENALNAPFVGPVSQTGIEFLAWLAANEVDEFVEGIIDGMSKGKSFKEATQATFEKWQQSDWEIKSALAGTKVLGYAISHEASQSIQEALHYYKVQRGIKSASDSITYASASTGAGLAVAIAESVVAYIIADIVMKEYIKIHDAKHLAQSFKEIDLTVQSTTGENAETNMKAIGKKFSDIRALRRAWLQANDKEVAHAFSEMIAALNDYNQIRDSQNKFMALDEFASKKYDPTLAANEEHPDTIACMNKISSLNALTWKDPKCLNELSVCRHLGRLKNLARSVYKLEESRKNYEQILLKKEKQSITAIEQYSGDLSILKPKGNKNVIDTGEGEVPTIPINKGPEYFSNIAKLTTTDLYHLERNAYSAILVQNGFKIKLKKSGEPLLVKNPPISETDKKLLREFGKANNRTVLAENVIAKGNPQNRFDLAIKSKRKTIQGKCPDYYDFKDIDKNLPPVLAQAGKKLTPLYLILTDNTLWKNAAQKINRSVANRLTSPASCTPRVMNCIIGRSLGAQDLVLDLYGKDGANCDSMFKDQTLGESEKNTIQSVTNFISTYYSDF